MVKIGLEIHGYLSTKEKLFCSCSSEHGLKYSVPNTNICPICTGQPGAKPMPPNKESVDKLIKISLILGCKINKELRWWRKHYNWPDLPKGYQNTISGPYATPNGVDGIFLGIRIRECHLEEDPAAWNPKTGGVDYNRSGSPLVEIVTEPDFSSSEEVLIWLKKLIITLDYIKVIKKEAGLKSDVNVSVEGGERIEVKNVNSLRNIKNTIDYEIERQKESPPKFQETRRFEESKGITKSMRSKENSEDYRFLIDPDLPPIVLSAERIKKIKNALPETPLEKIKRLTEKYNLKKEQAELLTKKLENVEFFEKVIEKISPEFALPWMETELFGMLNYNHVSLNEIEIKPEHFIELLKLVQEGKLTKLKAKEILRKFIPKSFSPKSYVEENGKISDSSKLKEFAEEILKENKEAVKDYKEGKKEVINFLVGQLMKKTNKRADYKIAKESLIELLDKFEIE